MPTVNRALKDFKRVKKEREEEEEEEEEKGKERSVCNVQKEATQRSEIL
jgi:Sec-independent protein translocase protein TatA